ncbi:GNAT family N-acetyltransferase [Ferrimonas sp. YFM]|uniref:GNAT family N-acetyltransferase n=1 Tax=Ferrimonas sp. YFM TaxID=3028878 RepID=UPI002573B22B|nr:GNAT family N-acetyltransferase [Ferrimonas sp. YFM]BDY04478.1 acetyltransferase [Ferrimonas sp. YFM]
MSKMDLQFRPAERGDLESLVGLLADDALGQQREHNVRPLPDSYHKAFEAIEADDNNLLLLATHQGQLVGMLQLTFIPYLTHQGSWRCLVEGVRIASQYRGKGCGEQMFEYAIELARERGCAMVQLTSDKQRPDAIRFYEKLGFTASHEGFKLSV